MSFSTTVSPANIKDGQILSSSPNGVYEAQFSSSANYPFKISRAAKSDEKKSADDAKSSESKPAETKPKTPKTSKLFDNSFDFFHKILRDEKTGLYYDKCNIKEKTMGGISFALSSTGMGFVTVCIGVELGKFSQKQGIDFVVQTLNSLLTGFASRARSANGFFTQYILPNTGLGMNTDEFSTIDTTILCLGAIFASNYFQSDSSPVTSLVDELVKGIVWKDAICTNAGGWSPANGKHALYTLANKDGSMPLRTEKGVWNLTRPFNEYYLLPFIGKYAELKYEGKNGVCAQFMHDFLDSPAKSSYIDRYDEVQHGPLFTDAMRPLPCFIVQFCFYLSATFRCDDEYFKNFCANAASDYAWFGKIDKNDGKDRAWGTGAGVYLNGNGGDCYKALSFKENDEQVFSVPIVAGFFPARAALKKDFGIDIDFDATLQHFYDKDIGAVTVETKGLGLKVLWRRSLKNRKWEGLTIEGIDFSTMVLGFGYRYLGAAFFDNACRYPTSVVPYSASLFGSQKSTGALTLSDDGVLSLVEKERVRNWNCRDTLSFGETLWTHKDPQTLTCGKYTMYMHYADGYPCISKGDKEIWNSKDHGTQFVSKNKRKFKAPFTMYLQTDNKLVVHDADNQIIVESNSTDKKWATGAYIFLTGDGKLIMNDGNNARICELSGK